jgi:hypothetical protein
MAAVSDNRTTGIVAWLYEQGRASQDACGQERDWCDKMNCAALEIERLRAEVQDLRISVITFGAPYAASYAEERGLPRGHLWPEHYDILARAGARMDDFTRAERETA